MAKTNWGMWCRLCANDSSNNINMNMLLPESELAQALNNFFSINISDSNNLGCMICLDCHETVNKIVEFCQKVSRVQKMFSEILQSNEDIDIKQLRIQYELDEEPDHKPIEPEISISQEPEIDLFEFQSIKIETQNFDDCQEKTDIIHNQRNEQPSKTIEEDDDDSELETKEPEKWKDESVKCSECKKTYSNLNSMKRHLRRKHGLSTRLKNPKLPFVCEQCGKTCKTLAHLESHKLLHTDDRPFQCNHCEKCFKNKLRLKFHEDTHNITSYICTICGVRLNSKPTLRMHMVVHSDQKRFKCDYCGNEYKRAKALKAHLILHTGLKPYACDFCDRTFANGSNCRSHKKKSHPIELAAMEAAGKTSSHTRVPELKDLKAGLPLAAEVLNNNECAFSL